MTRLIRVELRRLLSRRILRVMTLLAVLGVLTGATTTFVKSHHPDASTRAEIQRLEQDRVDQVLRCSRGELPIPASEIPPGETLQSYCERNIGPAETPNPEFAMTEIRGAVLGTLGVLIVLMLVIGATFIGAEWHSGSMAALLTWEPRRARVFMAKATAAALVAFVWSLAVLTFLGLTLIPAALFRGTSAGADGAWLASTIGVLVRGSVVASVAAVIGLAVASVGRNTAAALGGAFAYFALVEPLVRGLRPTWVRWLLTDNVATFVLSRAPDDAGFIRSPAVAALWVCLVTAALAGVSLLAFQRRDVT
jgi:hypothetical protein